jgi:hypothetical protein
MSLSPRVALYPESDTPILNRNRFHEGFSFLGKKIYRQFGVHRKRDQSCKALDAGMDPRKKDPRKRDPLVH